MRLMPRSQPLPSGSLLLAALAATLASMALAPPAHAAPAAWGSFAGDVSSSWARLQNANGTFPDYVYGGRVSFCLKLRCAPGLGNARYGESVLGYGLIQEGVRTGNRRLSDAGL